MAKVYLLLGGNTGSRRKQLELAITKIDKYLGTVLRTSYWYETEAWGYESELPYLNVVVELQTKHRPVVLLNALLAIEKDLGRVRLDEQKGYQDRPVDIDILLYGDKVMDSEKLTVPHPRMGERRFALAPLCDLIPEKKHPISKATFKSMLHICADKSLVEQVQNAV